jgi:hypothetical protein
LPANSEIKPNEGCPRDINKNARLFDTIRGNPNGTETAAIEVRIPSLASCRPIPDQGIISWWLPKSQLPVGISERVLPINYISYGWNKLRLGDSETGQKLYDPEKIILDVYVGDERFRPSDSIPPATHYNSVSGVGWQIDLDGAYKFILIGVKDKNWEIIDDLKEPVLFLGAGIFFGNVDWRTMFPQNGRSRKTLSSGVAGNAQAVAVDRVRRRRWLSLPRRENKTPAEVLPAPEEGNDERASAEVLPAPEEGNDERASAEVLPAPEEGNDERASAEVLPAPEEGNGRSSCAGAREP